MTTKLLLFLSLGYILLNSFNSSATSITVSGTITTNTTWSADTVKVIGDVMLIMVLS